MTSTVVLDLDAFAAGSRHLTPAVSAALAEAAVVCLELQGHATGVPAHGDAEPATIHWSPLDPRAQASHADTQRATEDGAVALAALHVKERHGFEPVRQSRKGPGFDWYLLPATPEEPFDDARCLEVSGVLEDHRYGMESRLKRKVKQILDGGSGLPGYAVVVGFQTPAIRVQVVP